METEETLSKVWDQHVGAEFAAHNADQAVATMTAEAYVISVPLMIGATGRNAVRDYYANHFVSQIPPDTEIVPLSRTIGRNRLVDEMIFRFTHTLEMDWMLPGVAPTGKRVECGLVVIVHFRDGKLSSEHIYWDQASVLVQLGLLDPSRLPVAGIESAKKLTDSSLPSNHLIERVKPEAN